MAVILQSSQIFIHYAYHNVIQISKMQFLFFFFFNNS